MQSGDDLMSNASSMVARQGVAPLLVAVVGGALLAWSAPSLVVGLALAGALLAVAAGAWWWERRRLKAAVEPLLAECAAARAMPRLDPYVHSLHELADASLIRWSKHVTIARQQTETAGTELTQDFSAILAKLGEMIDARNAQSGEAVVTVIERSREDLLGMLERLGHAFAAFGVARVDHLAELRQNRAEILRQFGSRGLGLLPRDGDMLRPADQRRIG